MMISVNFYEEMEDALLKFAVIITRHEGKWVFCKHRDRKTYEIPRGKREQESIMECAKRELQEETGALDYKIQPLFVYGVKGKTTINNEDDETYGMVFLADVHTFEKSLHYEMERIIITDQLIANWTYPEIHPKLIAEARTRGFCYLM